METVEVLLLYFLFLYKEWFEDLALKSLAIILLWKVGKIPQI